MGVWLGVCVFRQNRFGDFVLTREARLSLGATILVYRGKATVQVNSSSFTTGPRKVCVLKTANICTIGPRISACNRTYFCLGM